MDLLATVAGAVRRELRRRRSPESDGSRTRRGPPQILSGLLHRPDRSPGGGVPGEPRGCTPRLVMDVRIRVGLAFRSGCVACLVSVRPRDSLSCDRGSPSSGQRGDGGAARACGPTSATLDRRGALQHRNALLLALCSSWSLRGYAAAGAHSPSGMAISLVSATLTIVLTWATGVYEAAQLPAGWPGVPWPTRLLPFLFVSWPAAYLLATARRQQSVEGEAA